MVDFIIVFIVLLFLNQLLISSLVKRHPYINRSLLNKLYLYHLVFFLIYFTYCMFNPSDSKLYYVVSQLEKDTWTSLFASGTDFVSFVAAPFVQMGFSYITTMLLFSWFGYVGFIYAYLFFRENIKINVKVFGRYDLLTMLLFFPNMHFWTVSLGKGSMIFMGLMLFTYSVRYPQKRLVTLLIGGFFVYMVRPHVMLFVLVGVMVGLLTGREKLSAGLKFTIILASVGFLVAASGSILAVAKLENSENVVNDFEQFAEKRSVGLSESAGSGVQMNNYPLPLKLFTLWFRPLFVDSPGALGIFSSGENLIYLLLFAKIINKRFWKFLKRAPYLVKMSAITFLLSSFALTFVMSNLGIIMRQKSMVMYFGFFVIYYFLADEQLKKKAIAQNKIKKVAI